jgi:hypothetical protein
VEGQTPEDTFYWIQQAITASQKALLIIAVTIHGYGTDKNMQEPWIVWRRQF